ncbi:MAG: hypothetical protein KGJ08_08590 [Gammaproteobacteria bacterium]|nr:hypothetical protein [Gammaproteobacteria bacterium]
MNARTIMLSLTIATPLVFSAAVSAPAATINISATGNHFIHTRNGNVIITNEQGDEAVITPEGALLIQDKPIAVQPQDKVTLLRYANTVKDMEQKGMQLGMEAGGFAMSIVGDVFSSLFSADADHAIEQKTDKRVREFKLKALPICKDAQTLRQLQDVLVSHIPAFRPYAVVHGKDADNCQHDLESDD